MTTHHEQPLDDLRLVTSSLREWLLWHHACGCHGLFPAPPSIRPADDPIDSLYVPPPAPRLQIVRDVPAFDMPVEPPRPAPRKVERVVLSPEERAQRLAATARQTSGCDRCALKNSRKQVVYGIGPIDVEIMIVGEGPGVDEDEQGEPFVGKAGQLLDRMLAAMGLQRNQVYIANVVKCHPENNRTPDDDEISACMPHLREQIELVRPKMLLAMGNVAIRGLLGVSGITKLRGKWKLFQGSIPLMPTFHPAYLLRVEAAKREAWADLKEVLKHLGREVPKPRS